MSTPATMLGNLWRAVGNSKEADRCDRRIARSRQLYHLPMYEDEVAIREWERKCEEAREEDARTREYRDHYHEAHGRYPEDNR